jgi:eukaryotic-like serine/threonine-protein kinase
MAAFEFALPGAPQAPGFAFPSARFTIGSAPEAHLRFDARLVQPQHAEVAVDPSGNAWIRDLTNQGLVWVDGAQVSKAALPIGAVLRLGQLDLEVREISPREIPLDATSRRPTPFASPPIDATARRPTPFQAPQAVRNSRGNLNALATGGAFDPSQQRTSLSGAFVPGAGSEPGVSDETFMRTVLPEGAVVAGRYRIIKKLAAGGMGEVYQAEHIELQKQFALKVMLPALSSDPEFVNRFKREAISASRIGQQNIIDISDFGQTDDGRFYFVMEFLDGVTIASLLHRQGPMPLARMVSIGLQTTRALAAAHAQGIVHRDMKPENVMVLQRPGQPDFVKVLDFGVAKVSTGPGQGGQTQLGMVVGTPQYMSPEQAMGVVVDSRTDTYALGLIFYEMLTAQPTFKGDTASILMVKQVTEPAPPFEPTVAATLPAQLHDLIFHMLEKDPNARPANLEKVVDVLDSLQAQLKVGAKLAPATASGRFPSTATPHSVSPVRISSTGLMSNASPQTQKVVPAAAEEPIVAPAKSKGPLIAAAVVVLLLVAGGAAAVLKPKEVEVEAPQVVPAQPAEPPKPLAQVPVEPPPVAPSAPRVVKFTLETNPPGAEVFEKDVSLGTTPLVLQREAQSIAELKFVAKGYLELTRKVAIPLTDEARTFELEKVKKASGTGSTKPPAQDLKDPYAPTEDLKDPYQ